VFSVPNLSLVGVRVSLTQQQTNCLFCLTCPIMSYRIWCSHRGGYEVFQLLGYNAVAIQPTFRRNLSPLSSGPENMPARSRALLHMFSMLVPCFAYFLTLNMKACSPETSVNFQQTTWRHIPVSRTFPILSCLYRIRNRAVGIATGYGVDHRGVRVRVSVGSRIFSAPRCPDLFWARTTQKTSVFN
jgi:hypothetical protein